MVENLLKSGKIISPKNLKIKQKINIGLIGSGKIAEEYIKVIKSFDHNILILISESKNKNALALAKKYKSNLYSNISDAEAKFDKIDAWIVCTHWQKLEKYLKYFLNTNKTVLIEKSISINSTKIKSLIKNSKNNKKISIAYNRNYYDYMPFLINKIKNNKLNYIDINLNDQYTNIIKSKGKKIKKNLSYYITSHWISLILKIFALSKIKIKGILSEKLNEQDNFDITRLTLKVKKDNEKISVNIINFPNGLKNHSFKFYFQNFMIELCPIEKMILYSGLKKVIKKKINIYKPTFKNFSVNKKFKSGFRFQYYEFINEFINKKKSPYKTDLKDLIKVYELCEKLNIK